MLPGKEASDGGGGVAGDTQKRRKERWKYWENGEKGKLTTPSQMALLWAKTL